MIGVIVYLMEGQLASIGDLSNKFKIGGVYQSPHAKQNLGIDRLTINKINELLEKGVGQTVTEVRNSSEFKEWIQFTFEEKLNKVCIATDGLILGQEDENQVYTGLERCKSAQDFNSFINNIGDSQSRLYREDVCTQEKEHDDIGGVFIRLRNEFNKTKLGSMLSF